MVMQRYKKEPWYSFELDDYSAPSCTSFTKLFFGTVEDFRQLLNGIPNGEMDELKSTFEHFAAGERRITHYAGFIKTRFAIPVQVLGEKFFELNDVNYLYENSYGFYYKVRFSRAAGTAYLIKRNKVYYLAYRVKIENPEYCDTLNQAEKWYSLGDMIWGHQGVLKIENSSMENTLALIESSYENVQVARARFDELSLCDWSSFFEEVFGDG